MLPPAAFLPKTASVEYGADDPEGAAVNEGPIVEEFVPMVDLVEADRERTTTELRQAINVAAAYYEDSLAVPPEAVFTAGTISSAGLGELMLESGLRTREVLQAADLLATATTPVPHGLLAGLRGALRS